MFSQIPEPLIYAQVLVDALAQLLFVTDKERLVRQLTETVAKLTGCEVCQVYEFNEVTAQLHLTSEFADARVFPVGHSRAFTDFRNESLLQTCLLEKQEIVSQSGNFAGKEIQFLKDILGPESSLLCLPLLGDEQRVSGVLLCMSRTSGSWSGYAPSIRKLGESVLRRYRSLPWLGQTSIPSSSMDACEHNFGLQGNSPRIRLACGLVSRVLSGSSTVLLTGETGTGKEVVARAIHDHGPRSRRAFIVQNCAAFPEHLLESELFGYCKGAFTGADRDRKGLFDAANSGTLLLDEIGDMPLPLQAKLLRVLQEGEVRPVGSTTTHKVDVRIIAATHQDLANMVSQGRFRADLYYRLSQFPIALPALRERDGDVATLARHFAEQACNSFKRAPLCWSESTLLKLVEYEFPGNVRELKALVERAVLLCDGDELLPEHFPSLASPVIRTTTFNLRERLEQVERGVVLECLHSTGGNRTSAARKLGVSRRTLFNRMTHLCIGVAEKAG